MQRIPVTLHSGVSFKLSPGGQNVLVKQIIDEFAERFTPSGEVLYIGDTDEKFAFFAEDRLRMLRAVRLAARLGFAIAPETFAAIQELAPTITDIAWERIGDEVVKILTAEGARRAFTLLSESSLLRAILPEIEAMRGVEQSPDFHPEGDVFVHTLLLLDKLDHPSETLALSRPLGSSAHR